MDWYNKKLLPKILNAGMLQKEVKAERAAHITPYARGVVLDVGAGSATNFPYFGAHVTKVIALEPSRELWDLGAERVAVAPFVVEYVQASAEDIPLADASVDTVVTALTLCSIPNVKKALSEIRRVLKPGGVYAFVDHGLAPNKWQKRFQKLLNPIQKPFLGGCNWDRPIDQLITEAGFDLQEATVGYGFGPLIYLYRGHVIK